MCVCVRLGCFATSTGGPGNRNIISTIQFSARENNRKVVGKKGGKQKGSEEETQSDTMPAEEIVRR